MITRLLIWISFLVISAGPAMSQVPVDPAIKAKFDAFVNYSNKQQWDSAFSLVYPKLFSRVPRQDLIDMMERMQVGLKMKMTNTNITSSSSPVQEGNETFVRLSYESDIIVSIDQGGMYDSPKATQAIGEQLKSAYGGRSVQWNQDLKEFNIRASKNMMAINSGNGDWKLVEINLAQPELMEFLFSPTIMDTLVRAE